MIYSSDEEDLKSGIFVTLASPCLLGTFEQSNDSECFIFNIVGPYTYMHLILKFISPGSTLVN